MARLVVVFEVDSNPVLDDPHEVVEDILAHAETLPTFESGVSWFLLGPRMAGTFVSAEWA
jgi:hypothetical protein